MAKCTPQFLSIAAIFFCLCACSISKKNTKPIPVELDCNCLYVTDHSFTQKIELKSNSPVSICAQKLEKNNTTLYSSLYIKKCGSIDTIQFPNNREYTYEKVNDTLDILPYFFLPTGADYSYKQTHIFIDKVFFNVEGNVKHLRTINPAFGKYTASQILDVFEEYQLSKDTSAAHIGLLMDKLLMASLSNNQLAVKTFNNFEAKFRNLSPVLKEKYLFNKQILMEYSRYL